MSRAATAAPAVKTTTRRAPHPRLMVNHHAAAKRNHNRRVAVRRGAVRGDVDYDVHTVMYGDTLAAVAVRYGTSVEALCDTNGLGAEALYVGQRLLIPSAIDASRTTTGLVKTMTNAERDREYAEARAARSEKRRAMESAPATRTHAATSSAVETLTRDEVAGLLAHREETVMLLVETQNCRWCDDVQPAWTAVAVCYANDPTVRVCRMHCDTDELKQFAGKYFRAKTFPTIVALPAGKGPVYRHASADRSVAALLEFAEEATGRNVPSAPIDVRQSMMGRTASEAMQYSQSPAAAMQTRSYQAPPASAGQSPMNVLTDAFGNVLGIHKTVGTGVQAIPHAAQNATTSQLMPLAVGGLVCAALLSAVANLAMTVKDLKSAQIGAPLRVPRRGTSMDGEYVVDEPADDYEEAIIEVSAQDDVDELAEWRALVVDELLTLPARAFLLVRIWFLIGKRVMELKTRALRGGGRSERRARRRDEDDY